MTDRTPLKHTWFQNPEKIEVNVMVKGRRPDHVVVRLADAGEGRPGAGPLTVLVHDETCPGSGASGSCTCDPGPATCSFELWGEVVPSSLSTEVLRSKVEIKLLKVRPGEMWPLLEKGEATVAAEKKKPGKNWDKIDDEDDDGPGKDAMGFFQHLFAGADDDTRRAMMKSYVESNGTSLSTNWEEVKSKDFSKEA